ncbi:MAG: hypothetical protein ABSG53_15340 [Thermoguttaceae bacterium]|jgi:hypothetical protein
MADFLDEEWAYSHSKIVSESFSTVTFDEAVSLVGIVSTYAIRPSDELQALALKAENLELNDIGPLEPQWSAILIAGLFGLDCDSLYCEFHRHWKRIRNSSVTESVKKKLESHRLVGKLVRLPPFR